MATAEIIYKVTAEYPSGDVKTRRYFTKAAAIAARDRALNPEVIEFQEADTGAWDEYQRTPAVSVGIDWATVGPWQEGD